MHRRRFLSRSLSFATAAAMPVLGSRVLAAPGAADARFLFVFLRGACDATNVVIPVGSPFYYESRPTIAIARPDERNPDAALPLASAGEAVSWGLHPALGDSIFPLWKQGQVAFVPFAGSDDSSRSHFETQDRIEGGLPVGGVASHDSGFLNRLAAALGARAVPVAFTDGLPTAMTGPIGIPNVSLKGNARTPFDDRQVAALASMYAGSRLVPSIVEGFELRRTVAEQAEREARAMDAPGSMSGTLDEMQAASRRALSARGFEVEARRMATLMRDSFNLGFIDVGGWDTHVNEGGAQGALAGLLGNLGRGLAAFAQDMGPTWSRTVVVVLSEFGRTFRENGTRGTDHGRGSVAWVLGGGVRGGRLAGERVSVERRTLNQDRDWPVLNEYRALLGGLFARMYGLDRSQLERIFPRAIPRDLDLV